MTVAGSLQSTSLDLPTLSLVAVCVAGLLGLFLIIDWLQQRNVRALAWWGSAYLIGASSMALWSVPAPLFRLPPEVPGALTFLACGMIWNGVRLFQGRQVLSIAAFAGAITWILFSRMMPGDGRIVLGACVVTVYTFFIAVELWRERRQASYSRTAAFVVPWLHAGIFLMPVAMHTLFPKVFGPSWLTAFTLQTILYAVGTAFIVMLMVKDHHVNIYRNAASTDHLTGLLNRRAFMENAVALCARQGRRGEPVTLLMFDLDRFKSINDRFGHSIGDDVLRMFAQVVRSSTRENDIIARLGGEEFAAIVPGGMEVAVKIGERIRSAFETAGVTVRSHAVGATVSIGAAASYEAANGIDSLIARADAALYRAKYDGRNRLRAAETSETSERVRLIAAARRSGSAGAAELAQLRQQGRTASLA
ncbi:MAG TPA: GGDEF domain-containing protein [Pseudolabrys sp.]|nr:GGDEF domain-containing protein [Pseudolabrys sp.]